MMKTFFIFCLVFATLFASSQSYNPYVNQGIISPAPLHPMEFNGTGEVSFNVGNTGSDPLLLVENQEMTLVITFSNGIPNNEDPLAAISGSWGSYFDWSYSVGYNSYTGVQNREIPGNSQGNITIQYKVSNNTPIGSTSNGFNVNLQPPPVTNGYNVTADDAISAYTYVQVKDYGDAPLSYGIAVHEINVFKTNGLYTNYIYLGSSVDPDPASQASTIADGDDFNGIDDEDGVVFPILQQGATVTIPVEITAHDLSYGFLHAWIDWNGDGDFADSEENILANGFVSGSGITNITVSVPDDAITSAPTFARFRIGNHSTGSSGANLFGEVEDYQIYIEGESGSNAPEVIAGNDIEVCGSAQFVEVSGSAVNASEVVWSGGEGFFDNPNATSTIYYFSAEDISNGTIELCLTAYATEPGLASVTDCLNLTIVQNPVAHAGDNVFICEGEPFQLSNSWASNYSSLLWTTSGDGEFDFTDIENPVYTPGPNDIVNGGTELCLTALPLSGCAEPDVDCMTITIPTQPFVEIALSMVELNCENYNEMNGEWMPIAMDVNTTGDVGSVQWTTTGDGNFSDPSEINAVYYLGLDDIWSGNVELCIEVQDAGSCQLSASDCMIVRVPQQLIYFDANTWYGVSSYLDPDQTTVPDVMDPLILIPGSQNLVMMNDAYGHIFWPEQINPTNTLGDWSSVGYKAKIKNTTACLPIYGDTLIDQTFAINGKFAYLPVLTNIPVNINNLFDINLDKLLLIYDWATAEIWTQAASDFDELMPGRAYLLVNKSSVNYTIEFPDFDPNAPHIYATTKDMAVVSNSPWNEIENTSQPHVIMFSEKATMDLQAGDIIGVFNSSDMSFGTTEYYGPGNFDKLIAMGKNPYSNRIDGFEAGEQMQFKLYRPSLALTFDITLEFDTEYPNYDGLFALNGVSRVIGITMAITSVDDHLSEDYNINVYPNPAIEIVNIASDHKMQSVIMLNHIGQKTISKQVSAKNCQIDVSTFSPGMYFLCIETSDGFMTTKRVIIE